MSVRGAFLIVALGVLGGVSESAELKAVYSGTVTLADASSSVTDTMPAVDTTKAFLVFGVSGSDNSPDDLQISGQITATTTVRFQRFGSTGAVSIHWYVAEFQSGVRVQRGTQQMPGAANPADTDVPIAAVDLARSFPLITLRTNGSNFDGGDFTRAKLTSSTNLRLFAPDADTSTFVEWQVVEYIDANVQTGDVTLSSAAASVSPGLALVRGRVTGANSLTFDRNNTGDGWDITWYLVEFTDQTAVQHMSEAFGTADLQRNVTLPSAINVGSSLAAGGYFGRGGMSNFAADDDPGVLEKDARKRFASSSATPIVSGKHLRSATSFSSETEATTSRTTSAPAARIRFPRSS